jgi:hypothetical protein
MDSRLSYRLQWIGYANFDHSGNAANHEAIENYPKVR